MDTSSTTILIVSVSGMLFASLGLIVRYAYKSKCVRVKICCFSFERDTREEVREDIEAMRRGINPVPSAASMERASMDGR